MKHKIKVSMTFDAVVEVEADNFTQARAAVLDHLSCVGPTWHNGGCDEIINWEASVHPVKKVLTPVDVIGIKHEDGSFRLQEPTVWPNVSELSQRAKNAVKATNLALVGVNLVEVFDLNPTLKNLKVSSETKQEPNDNGGVSHRFEIFVSADCGPDQGAIASDIEVDLEEAFIDGELGEVVYKSTMGGEIFVRREHLAPFLGLERISGLAVIKHLASQPECNFDDSVSMLEVTHV